MVLFFLSFKKLNSPNQRHCEEWAEGGQPAAGAGYRHPPAGPHHLPHHHLPGQVRTNQKPVFRSRDLYWPIRDQYLGHIIWGLANSIYQNCFYLVIVRLVQLRTWRNMIFTFRNATATIHIFSLTLSTKEQELIQEKQKMEDLLYLTLPFQVARHEENSKNEKWKLTIL